MIPIIVIGVVAAWVGCGVLIAGSGAAWAERDLTYIDLQNDHRRFALWVGLICGPLAILAVITHGIGFRNPWRKF